MKSQLEKITAPIESSLRQAMQVIDRGQIGAALLVDADSQVFKGIVTDGDIRRALLKGAGLDDPVTSCVSIGKAVVAHATTPFNEVLDLFSPAVRVIPIVDAEHRLVDIAIFDKRRFFPVAEPAIDEKEWEYVSDCVLSGWVSSTGHYIDRFEQAFAAFCGTKHAVCTSNGTTALHLALLACGIGPGDEVIVPTLTFIATANAVRYTGATPIFVDSERTTWNMDPQQVASRITSRTRAIIPVHLYGQPVDMEPILALADKYNLFIIEDAAEAHGAEYGGKRVGSIGDIGVFSFFGNKIVTTGEGGMVVTDSDAFADSARTLRDHGMDRNRRYWHTVLGYNYRMTNLQAALGVAQMEKIDAILLKKRRIMEWYNECLSATPGLILPEEPSWGRSVCWLYSLLVDQESFGMSRDELMIALKEQKVDTRPVFFPVHRQPVYNRLQENYPIAEYLSANGLSLPSSSKLSKESVAEIGNMIKRLSR